MTHDFGPMTRAFTDEIQKVGEGRWIGRHRPPPSRVAMRLAAYAGVMGLTLCAVSLPLLLVGGGSLRPVVAELPVLSQPGEPGVVLREPTTPVPASSPSSSASPSPSPRSTWKPPAAAATGGGLAPSRTQARDSATPTVTSPPPEPSPSEETPAAAVGSEEPSPSLSPSPSDSGVSPSPSGEAATCPAATPTSE